jgi:ribosomal protein S18 acetylase RimI-like enzyme
MLDSELKIIDCKRVSQTEHLLINIRELRTDELHKMLPLLSQFYPQLSEEILSKRLSEISDLNWKCIGVLNRDDLVGLSGYWLNTRLYCGKYLYIDHFVIDSKYHRSGVGRQLLGYLKRIAEQNNCEQICLDTFVTNSLAQSFWTRQGFNIAGFHYITQ